MIGGLVAIEQNAPSAPIIAPKIWRPASESLLSQPAFVPDGAGGGWLLAYLIDVATTRTRLVVLDALAIDRGPLAEVTLAPFLPPTSHCRFAPAAG
jgi:carotenoid cleavage dioxygenase-like enzyme